MDVAVRAKTTMVIQTQPSTNVDVLSFRVGPLFLPWLSPPEWSLRVSARMFCLRATLLHWTALGRALSAVPQGRQIDHDTSGVRLAVIRALASREAPRTSCE